MSKTRKQIILNNQIIYDKTLDSNQHESISFILDGLELPTLGWQQDVSLGFMDYEECKQIYYRREEDVLKITEELCQI